MLVDRRVRADLKNHRLRGGGYRQDAADGDRFHGLEDRQGTLRGTAASYNFV